MLRTAFFLFTAIAAHAQPSPLEDNFFALTDAIGPRVVGSDALHQARAYVLERLRAYGLENAHVERTPPIDVGGGVLLDPPGWSWSRLTVQQLRPWPQTLVAAPVLYSPATPGAVVGDIVLAPLPPPSEAELDAFFGARRGQLRNKFVLLRGEEAPITPSESPIFRRHSADDLRAMADFVPEPPAPPKEPPPGAAPQEPPPSVEEMFALQSRLHEFLRDEGVLGLIGPARRGSEGGTLQLSPLRTPPELVALPPPTFDLTPEHYNRLLRLVRRNVPVRLEAHLEAAFTSRKGIENVLAEIPGGDKADEAVLVGAHLDSWHGGTGATDNAANVATLLEAARILAALPAPPRRTVQFAFWDGEELGLAGSRGYVRQHLVPANGEKTAAYRKLSAYFNLDYGAGRIRGVYLQGNARLKPLFDQWLAPIGDAKLIATLRTTLGSDQASFEKIGIPGLSFVQDPLSYEARTHHTNMDDASYVSIDDLRANADTLAAVILAVANAEAMLPRKGEE
jgi:hypothetical protein